MHQEHIAALWPGRRIPRGFTNATLVVAAMVMALITILAVVQSGDVDWAALTAVKSTKSKKTKKGKPPPIIPLFDEGSGQLEFDDEEDQVATATPKLTNKQKAARELKEALAKMDSKSANRMLSEMEQNLAVELLSSLRERDLAWILDSADPLNSSRWAEAILKAAAADDQIAQNTIIDDRPSEEESEPEITDSQSTEADVGETITETETETNTETNTTEEEAGEASEEEAQSSESVESSTEAESPEDINV